MAAIQVPIKSGVTIAFDPELITDDDTYSAIFLLGLQAVLSKGMSKLTKNAFTDAGATKAGFADAKAHMEAEIAAKAEANAKDLLENGIKAKKAKAKVAGKVKVEAMRIARGLIRDKLKAEGYVLSHIKASEISAIAEQYLATDAGKAIITQAEANLKAREETPVLEGLDLSGVKVDPKLVAAAEEKKAKAKKDKPLSAKQAGMTAPRKKGDKPGAGASA